MAAHSNRSPSPLSSRPSNPNPRNPENDSATRRSFSGNNTSFVKPSLLNNPRRFDPIAPANSPSDFPRRWSVEKERDCDEKENEKDQNLRSLKLRSPAKNSKNFMSPTISAASKFAPSPKKKILVERNDPLRTSISFCDGKATFFSSINASQDLDTNSGIESNHNQTTVTSLDLSEKKAVHEVPPVSKPPKKVTFLDFPLNSNAVSESLPESVITDSDCYNLKLESGLKNNVICSSVSSSIASPNADTSLPPYDPKTNYLSPRPQFLHYKPNPRIGILLKNEKLEDSFLEEIMSENFSDSESTEESSQSEFSQKEEMEITDRHDTVLGLDETEEDSHVLEPSKSSTVSNAVYSDNLVHKREKKSWGLFKVTCFSVLLVFLIACGSVYVTRSDQFVDTGVSFSDMSSFYHEFKVSASEKLSFEKLARHVNEFSVNSMAFISKLIDKPGKGEKLGPLKFMNITDLQKSIWNEYHSLNNHIGKELVDDFEEGDEVEEEPNIEMDDFEAEFDSTESPEMELVENIEEDDELENSDTEIEEESFVEINSDKELSDLVMVTDSESENLVFVENQTEVVSHVNTKEIAFEAETIELAAETTKAENFEVVEEKLTILDNENAVDFVSSSGISQSSSKSESSTGKSENKLAHYIIGISSLFGALLGVAAVLYKLKRSHRSGNIMVETKPFLREQIHQEKPISKNLQQEVEEPCPSDMSNFNSAFYGKKELRGELEAQSFEGKGRKYLKRESLASSSTEYSIGAPSYGSFTTFERIPIKHGDDEIITPVRRSSRIRKQVTSP